MSGRKQPLPCPVAAWLLASVVQIQTTQWKLVLPAPVLAVAGRPSGQPPLRGGARSPASFTEKQFVWSKKKKPPPAAPGKPRVSFEHLGFLTPLTVNEEEKKGLESPFFMAHVQPVVFFDDGTCYFVHGQQMRAQWAAFSAELVDSEEEAVRPAERRGTTRLRVRRGQNRSFRDLGTYTPSSRALLEHVASRGTPRVVSVAQLRLLEITELARNGPGMTQPRPQLAWGLGSVKEVMLLSLNDWVSVLSSLGSISADGS